MFGGKTFKANKKKSTAKKQEDAEEPVEPQDEQLSGDPFTQDLLKTGNVRLAVYTGQFTRDELVGADIVIVGDINHSAIEKLISDLETAEKKELRYSVFSPSDFNYRKQINDRFVSNLMLAKKIVLIDKDKLL
jgi:hypothetical protein